MASKDQAQALYIAYFARPADARGLEHWTNGLGLSTPLELIADGFAITEEYRDTVLSKGLEEIIDGFYFNLFGRGSEKEGRDFWVTTIQNGLTTTQQAGLVIGQAAVDSPGNSDHEAIKAKILASNLFTDETGKTQQGLKAYQGPEAVQKGTKYLSDVRSEKTIPSPEQVSAYVASFSTIDEFPNLSFELSEFVDIVTNTGFVRKDAVDAVIEEGVSFGLDARDQTIIGTGSTFTGTDFIADPSTTDSDVLRLTGISEELPVATVENIEYLFLGLDQFGRSGGKGPHHPFGPKLDAPARAKFKNLKFLDISGTLASVRLTGVETQMYLDLRGTGVSTVELMGLTSEGLDESTVIVADNVDTEYFGSELNDTFIGGSKSDKVTFTRSANEFQNAGFGNDQIFHLGGSTDVQVVGPDKVIIHDLSDRHSLFRAFGHIGHAHMDASSSTSAVNLFGGVTSDFLVGGAAADLIVGGNGLDFLTGNGGNDVFRIGLTDNFATGLDLGASGADVWADGQSWVQPYDLILDFKAGDRLDFSDASVNHFPDTNLTFAIAGIGFANHTNFAVRGDYGDHNRFTINHLLGDDVLVLRTAASTTNSIEEISLGQQGIVLDGFGENMFQLSDPAFYDKNALVGERIFALM